MNNKLLKIQQELKCNKGQYNSFGKYKYRSCEDILESVKPLLNETKCTLILNDELTYIGERYYIKATATLRDTETNEQISNTAYAREELEKRGMDGSQITGTASSYARKYALNGLFLIDDTKDADTDEYRKQIKTVEDQEEILRLIPELNKLLDETKTDRDKFYTYYKVKTNGDMTLEQLQHAIGVLKKKVGE